MNQCQSVRYMYMPPNWLFWTIYMLDSLYKNLAKESLLCLASLAPLDVKGSGGGLWVWYVASFIVLNFERANNLHSQEVVSYPAHLPVFLGAILLCLLFILHHLLSWSCGKEPWPSVPYEVLGREWFSAPLFSWQLPSFVVYLPMLHICLNKVWRVFSVLSLEMRTFILNFRSLSNAF